MKLHADLVILAGALRDAAGAAMRGGAIGVRKGRISWVGRQDQLPSLEAVRTIDLNDSLVMPALVNAHTHLCMTGIGAQPLAATHSQGSPFTHWLLNMIQRMSAPDYDAADNVRQGVELCRQTGVGVVGDVAFNAAAVKARIETRLPGVSYLECFGIGARQQQAMDELKAMFTDPPFDEDDPLVRIGLQPHAPYSAGRELYKYATQLSHEYALRLSTHLAETPEEIEFIEKRSGPLVDLLKTIDRWDDSITAAGVHPVDHLKEVLMHGNWMLAHCNYVNDDHIALLKRARASVAYCPIASEYFGHRGHRYRDMLAAGVNVCLGTDSIVCQPESAVDRGDALGILPQMRRLFHRDHTDPNVLLRMATINGLKAMTLPEHEARLRKGEPARLAAVKFDSADKTDALEQVLLNDEVAKVVAV